MVSGKTLWLLALLVVVAVAAAWRTPGEAPSAPGREPLLPGFAERINDVDTIHLRDGAGELVVARGDEGWSLPGRDGYPADTGAVRALLLSLAEARIVEPKTARPELYARLGLEDVSAADAASVEVRVGAAGNELAALVVGNAAGDDRYVRRLDDPRAARVTAIGAVRARAQDWLASGIIDAGRDEVAAVTVHQGPGTVSLRAGPGGSMRLDALPRGKQVSYQFALDDFAAVFADLDLLDVRAAAGLDFDDALHGQAVLADGVVIQFDSAEADGQRWLRFSARADGANEPAAERAARWNTRWDGWAYRLRDADLARLRKPMDELVEDAESVTAPVDTESHGR